MHETMVAQSLLTTVLAEAEKQNARPFRVKISCGTFNVINDEILGLAFEAIAEDTACEGIELQVEHKPMSGKCNDCGAEFEFELVRPDCSKCGSENFDLLPDAPLLLETIEFKTE